MGKFDGILLVSDMDGTMLTGDKRISDENRQAVARFTREGGWFCMATGRPPATTSAFEPLLPCGAPKIYLNGALIRYDAQHVLRQFTFGSEIWPLIETICADFPTVGCELFAADEVFLYRSSPETTYHMQLVRRQFAPMTAFVPGMALYDIALTGKPEVLQQIRTAYFGQTDRYSAVMSAPNLLEVTRAQADKGTALCTVAEHLGVERARTFAIGDGGNDLSMLKAAGYSFAPENADAAARAAAAQIVPDNEHSAVAYAIAQIEAML